MGGGVYVESWTREGELLLVCAEATGRLEQRMLRSEKEKEIDVHKLAIMTMLGRVNLHGFGAG